MNNKIRLIDANALAKKIREYMADYPNAIARLTACRAILSMLGDENQTPTVTADRSERCVAPLFRQGACEWCQPNADGEYSMLAFHNTANPAQQATVSFYEGMFVAEFSLCSAAKPERLSAEIKFCPFCGRKF